jgi:hypothetical protein
MQSLQRMWRENPLTITWSDFVKCGGQCAGSARNHFALTSSWTSAARVREPPSQLVEPPARRVIMQGQ